MRNASECTNSAQTLDIGNSCVTLCTVTSSDPLLLSMICAQTVQCSGALFSGRLKHEPSSFLGCDNPCLFVMPLPELAPLDQSRQCRLCPPWLYCVVISQESGAGPGAGQSWSHLRNGKSDGEAPTARLRDQEETMGKLELFCTTLHKL